MKAKSKAKRDLCIVSAIVLMTGVLLSPLLRECVTLHNCAKNPWRSDLHYGDHVKIVNGFFAGHEGTIEAQTWIYRSDECNIPALKLDVYDNGLGRSDEVIEQSSLEKL